MQIGSTLPPQNLHPSLARKVGFRCSASPLNPLNFPGNRNPADGTPTQITTKHLSNLEKLLQKQKRSPEPDPDLPTRPRGANGILERLNLTHLWPEMKSAEEMSPRHLNRLQRLLSDSSAEYSPRNSLAFRWREYHGSNNWSGMLDPLDENLRREVVRYGEFVQAAYHCFHSSPATSSGEAHRPPHHVTLPDRSYRVTKCLYTTASVGLPRWVDDMAPDLSWMTQRSSRVGFVAVCDDPREIQRMGRRDIVIALRGTATCLEWAENFRTRLISTGDNGAKVQRGFRSLFKTRGHDMPSLAESVADEINRLTEKYRGETLSVTVTGHSLGAALALLVADGLPSGGPPVAAISFGGPRVGNRGFTFRLESKGVKVLRVVNERDVVTRVPGVPVGERLIEGRSWAYTHVGSELRVETRMSPFLRADADVGCCHDLEAYLHLVDGFSASDGPFRADAKRSLWRLVNQQRSNMKRLYTSKGMELSSSDVCRDVSVV